MVKHKTFLNWSSGKDAALALHHLKNSAEFNVEHLLTSVNSHHNRVSMHGLRRELLNKQIESIGISSSTVELPEQPDMEVYEKTMEGSLLFLRKQGFTHSAFGDIFLEDLRSYRERQFKKAGVKTVFPIWKRNTKELIAEFLDLGFRALIIASNASLLDESFIGRELDYDFVKDLPSTVDPCGENGEFHTFCFDGPIFSTPVLFSIGEKTYREYDSPKQDEANNSKTGFWFCDLIPE